MANQRPSLSCGSVTGSPPASSNQTEPGPGRTVSTSETCSNHAAEARDLKISFVFDARHQGSSNGKKVSSLVGGMVAGADSIDDMAVLRHGGMDRIFDSCYAPSTLGSFLGSFTFGHVRQLDAVASRFLVNLERETPIVPAGPVSELVFVDVDDTIIEVHGHQKQGAGCGYSGVRGINALLATVSTKSSVPVIIAQRLRKGASGSPRGAEQEGPGPPAAQPGAAFRRATLGVEEAVLNLREGEFSVPLAMLREGTRYTHRSQSAVLVAAWRTGWHPRGTYEPRKPVWQRRGSTRMSAATALVPRSVHTGRLR